MNETLLKRVRAAALLIALSALFTWLGVYERGDSPWAWRFSLWLVFLSVGALSAMAITPFVFSDRFDRIGAPGKIVLCAGLVSIPVTACLLGLQAVLGAPEPVSLWPIQYLYVFVISLMVTIGAWFLSRHDAVEKLTAEGLHGATNPIAAFTERLPVKYRTATIFAVSSEDHYLRVHTALGETLILMRLGDAVRELAGADGLQVHRSWWVANDAVTDVKRVNGKPLLVLKSGTVVPVSRTYAKAVKAAGLI